MPRWMLSLVLALSVVSLATAATPFETVLLPTGTYAVGTYVMDPVDVPASYVVGTLKVDRAEWLDDTVLIELIIEEKQTAESDWHVLGSATSKGGLYYRRGVLVPQTTYSVPLPAPELSTRQMRGTLVISGGSLTSTIYGEIR